MRCYELTFTQLPRVAFACSASTDRYCNHFDHKGTLEITTVEGSGIDLTIEGETLYVPPRSVVVILPDTVCDIVVHGSGIVRDDTIAMDMGDLLWERLPDGGSPAEDRILLPMVLTPGDDYPNITRLMRTFISRYMRDNASSRCECLSLWFELLAFLNGLCRRSLQGQLEDSRLPSSRMYVRKAKSYIERHYAERLLIPEVAQELRITPNYLSSMFKQITGKTVLDYIHMVRIQAVKELLDKPKSGTLSEIAAKTGLGNARNLCSLFRKTCGVSVREYLQISKELTVYHARPWDEKQEDPL